MAGRKTVGEVFFHSLRFIFWLCLSLLDPGGDHVFLRILIGIFRGLYFVVGFAVYCLRREIFLTDVGVIWFDIDCVQA